jgi:site-specific DNA-methyltransferase (adenine-specific)
MPEYEDHPSQKPESLLERIILASSSQDDVVLDPFAGTFTTCAVAKRLKRDTIGIEVSDKYFKTGARRLNLAKVYNGEKLVKNLTKKTQNRNKSDHLKPKSLGQLSFMNP